jgi:hypothetical protein
MNNGCLPLIFIEIDAMFDIILENRVMAATASGWSLLWLLLIVLAFSNTAMARDNRLYQSQWQEQQAGSQKDNNPFAASGKLICPYGRGSAQLTHRPDIITTVAHNFFLRRCKDRNKSCWQTAYLPSTIQQCRFRVQTGKTFRDYALDTGFMRFGTINPYGELSARSQDWAVIRLEKPVTNVTPYALPELANWLVTGDKIIGLSNTHTRPCCRNFNIRPLAVTRCQADRIAMRTDYGLAATRSIRHDCYLEKGDSGGAILKQNEKGHWSLLAIHRGKQGDPSRKGYDAIKHYRIGILIERDFYEAILSLAEKN